MNLEYKYPKILAKDKYTILSHLNNIEDGKCSIREQINSLYTLSFTATFEPLKVEEIYNPDNIVEWNNDYFRVLTIEEIHSDNASIILNVQCEHISYDLLNYEKPSFIYQNKLCAEAANAALIGTPFQFIGSNITKKSSINYEEPATVRKLICAIANDWKGEIKYFRNQIRIDSKRGANRQVQFRFGKNLTELKRYIDRTTLDSDGNPTITYEIKIADFVAQTGYDELEYFELGDEVEIIDEALDIRTSMRIVELERDAITDTNKKVVLGSPLADIRASLSGTGSSLTPEQKSAIDKVITNGDTWDIIDYITNDMGLVITEKLTGNIQTESNKVVNATGTVVFDANGIMIHNQPTEALSNSIIKFGAEGMLIANNKNPDGSWQWRTAITGNGVIADSVAAGAIDGMTIQGMIINGGEINGGDIRGAVISAGSSTIFSRVVIGERDGFVAPFKIVAKNPFNPSIYDRKLITLHGTDFGGELRFYDYDCEGQSAHIKNTITAFSNTLEFRMVPVHGMATPTIISNYANNFIFEGSECLINTSTKATITSDLFLGGTLQYTRSLPVATRSREKVSITSYPIDCIENITYIRGIAELVDGKAEITLTKEQQASMLPNSENPYHVMLTPYFCGEVWVEEINDTSIIFKSKVGVGKVAYTITGSNRS